ncbi:MAG: FAD-dependent oxidoreductase [Verrucomicrobiae bacterium]|nr:FAD-dependent oxidoreductase [Verrucomicrobiae bacterium]
MKESRGKILIVGGGLGGVAAAMSAASLCPIFHIQSSPEIILTEETDWLGGQLTSQAVPPDEHPWIEKFGCTQRYRVFRNAVRQYYRNHYPLIGEALSNPELNPGMGGVSRLCHEPRVALAALEQMLAYPRSANFLEVRLHRKPTAVDGHGDRIHAVRFQNLETGHDEIIQADYIIDATELGDLLPMAKVEYVSGSESRTSTGEPHASSDDRPNNVQAFTWCFPMAFDPRGEHIIDKPLQYDRWRNYMPRLTPPWPGRLLDWKMSHPRTQKPRLLCLFPNECDETIASLWLYRRIICGKVYQPDLMPHEITLVNWPQNDYWEGNIIDQPPDVAARFLEESRQLSLSLLYWLQTEAPCPKGGQGYPGLYLRPDLVGTTDGLAKSPYIRESRRIRAMLTVTESHVGVIARESRPAEQFYDSVGVGCYRIDLHPTTGGDNYVDIGAFPFQIPLRALIPQRVENLLPACKNIGTTHITNGCYRLHPVEWNIGEAVGLLSAYCLKKKMTPKLFFENKEFLKDFQMLLRKQGMELEWPEMHPP